MTIESYTNPQTPENTPDFTDPFVFAAICKQMGFKVPEKIIDQCLERIGHTREDLDQLRSQGQV